MIDSLHIVCAHCGATNRLPATRLQEKPNCGKCHQPVFSGKPLVLDEAGFRHHIQRNDVPVLVDFWAQWCGPCKMMAPAFAQAAAQLEPGMRLAKVDTEQAPMLSQQLNIRSIPTLILFRQGKEVARQAGAMSAADIVRWAQAHR